MKSIAATCAAVTVAVMLGSAQSPAPQPPAPQPETQKITPDVLDKAKNLMQDVVRVGCLKAWQPGPPDATKAPDSPRMGIYVLTPITADPSKAAVDLSTYVLVGGATVNFAAHLNHKVEIAGVEATAQMPPTVQEIATAPTMKPENKPDTRSMPSLTVRSLKMISAACS